MEILSIHKHSDDPIKQEIFACIICNLFDEYKFHNSYPLKEL